MSLSMETTDEELVVAYLAGQEDVFPVLMDRYLRSLYGFVFQLVRSDSAAEDIVQETFIKTWKNLSRFDVKKSFKTWVFAIAKNTAYDYLKKKKTLPFSTFLNEAGESVLENISDGSIHPEIILDQEATAHDLDKKLQMLTPAYRTLLDLHYKRGFSLHEISDILQVPYNTVKSRHKRALESLRRAFTHDASPQENYSY